MYIKNKLKLTKDFEDTLNTIYDVYVLEDDCNLDDGAKHLKQCYKYVIEDMMLHGCILKSGGKQNARKRIGTIFGRIGKIFSRGRHT